MRTLASMKSIGVILGVLVLAACEGGVVHDAGPEPVDAAVEADAQGPATDPCSNEAVHAHARAACAHVIECTATCCMMRLGCCDGACARCLDRELSAYRAEHCSGD